MATGKMHARKGKGGSSGGGRSSREISEAQHDEAMRVLRAEYYQGGVRGIAHELGDRAKKGDIQNRDDWEEALHQAVDGSYWVIYTHANFQVLLCSDNHDAYMEDFGEAPVEGDQIKWAALAYAAMERDVRQQIDAESLEPDWDKRVGEARGVRESDDIWIGAGADAGPYEVHPSGHDFAVVNSRTGHVRAETPDRAEAIRMAKQLNREAVSDEPDWDNREAVSDAQIRALRREAGEHGDLQMAAICDRALRGDKRARAQCAHAIRSARGMQ